MTEKRFERIYADVDVFCRDHNAKEVSQLIEREDYDRIVDLLNELHDENQLLHKINEDAIDFMYDNFDLNIIFTDRELNDICNEMGWELSEKGIKINQLEKENEQLKQRIKELEQEIEKLDTFKKNIGVCRKRV